MTYQAPPSGRSSGSAASAWLIAILLTISFALFLTTFAAWQVTSEETGTRLLAQASVAIAGLDESAGPLADGLHEAAEENANPEIIVPDYPIVITVPREQALTIPPGELHRLLAEESAARIYADGMGVWAEADEEAFQNVERASTVGAVKYGLEVIQESNNTVFGIIAAFFGIISVILLVLLAIVLRTAVARLLVIGAVLVMAALPTLAAAVALRFAFKTSGDGDAFEEAMLDVGVSAMSVPIRDFLVVTLLGLALVGLGAGLLWWEGRTNASGSYDAGPSV